MAATGAVTDESAAVPGPPGSGRRELCILYVFAGAARDGDLRHWLEHFKGQHGLEVKEVDVLRGQGFDVCRARVRRQLLEEVGRGKFALVVVSPPCSTFSRARYSGRPGPPPAPIGRFPPRISTVEGQEPG